MNQRDRVSVRRADRGDLQGILQVEAAWPEDQRASADQIETRLERFSQGVFVALDGTRYVACTTSCPIVYMPEAVSNFRSWDEVTNHGLFPDPLPDGANALYIVSNGIIPEYRRTGLRERLIGCHLSLARRMNLMYVVTGAMLPGYARYCRQHGELPVADYADMKVSGKPVDPTLRKLGALGFRLPSRAHLIPDYYPSPESRDYAALMVWTATGSEPVFGED